MDLHFADSCTFSGAFKTWHLSDGLYVPFTSVYHAVCCCTFSLCFKANPWELSWIALSRVILSWIILILRRAKTLAVISPAGASDRHQNKTSVAWISFCGCMSCLVEPWVWRARRHGPPRMPVVHSATLQWKDHPLRLERGFEASVPVVGLSPFLDAVCCSPDCIAVLSLLCFSTSCG